MYEVLKAELDKHQALSTPLPNFLLDLANTIPNQKIPLKMKLTLVVSELILFISEFRRNIIHPNSSLIPINAISFCLTGSGVGKDSSVNILRKNFSKGYEVITRLREDKAINKAIEIATAKKKARASEYDVYKEFYQAPYPLFASPSTVEGFIQYLNDLDTEGVGAGYIYDGEFASSLSNNPLIISNLHLLSELYDEGKKEVKVLKNRENQSKEIKNLPVSALFVSSPENILYDDSVKKKFKTEFTSKLARRSFFNYNRELNPVKTYSNIDDFLADEIMLEDKASKISNEYKNKFETVAILNLDKIGVNIAVSKEARKILTIYKRFNAECALKVKNQYPITKLVITHNYWRALKLAGAFAVLKAESEISEKSYKEAISFVELLTNDMQEFEIELTKEPYELFVGLVHSILEDNNCFVSLHILKKLGYIQGNSNISTKLKELCILASSYDESGVYTPKENGIEFKKLIKTNALGISYKKVSGDKESRAKQCKDGFSYAEVSFSDLADMLKDDYAYSAFKFKDGIRSKTNVCGSIKWICLDIDKSEYTDKEMHEILKEFNHHIVRTSDKNNAYKFRIILELDSEIELNEKTYKAFIASVSEFLGVQADSLPKSQIYFSYKDRDILSVTNKNTILVKEHLLRVNMLNQGESFEVSKLSKEQRSALLNDPLGTFAYAYYAKDGEGSLSLIRAAKHARDLGMDKESIINLILDINEYWDYPMPLTRLENTILNQIRRWNC